MIYQKFKPCDQLIPFVRTYYSWENPENNDNIIVESPPSAYTGLVFNLGDDCKFGLLEKPRQLLPKAYYSGQATTSYTLELNGKISMFGAVLNATTLYKLFGDDQREFIDRRKKLCWSSEADVENLLNQLRRSTNLEKVQIIDNYLSSIVDGNQVVFDKFDESVALIDERNGNIKVNEILDRFGFSRRHYQKLFRERVGVSPKAYMRTKRMSRVCYLLTTTEEIDWQDIVFEGGYFDQSHFIKDFIDFIGRNPSLYFKNNQELHRLLQ
jgi:AraC-like DNA-binding protein